MAKKSQILQVVAVRLGQQPKIESWTYQWDSKDEPENRGKALLTLFSDFVDGPIERIYIGSKNVGITENEEGLLRSVPYNRCGIVGNFSFSSHGANGWPRSLTDEEIRKCLAWTQLHKDAPEPTLQPFNIYVGQEALRYQKEQQDQRQKMQRQWDSL